MLRWLLAVIGPFFRISMMKKTFVHPKLRDWIRTNFHLLQVPSVRGVIGRALLPFKLIKPAPNLSICGLAIELLTTDTSSVPHLQKSG